MKITERKMWLVTVNKMGMATANGFDSVKERDQQWSILTERRRVRRYASVLRIKDRMDSCEVCKHIRKHYGQPKPVIIDAILVQPWPSKRRSKPVEKAGIR